jgi:hypothetical protein
MTSLADLDLNLDNYEYQDIISLFSIPALYSFEDLKRAKQIVAQTHPDKSGLDAKYFIFFKQAFHVLTDIYRHRVREEKTHDAVVAERGDDMETSAAPFKHPTGKEFSQWFNRMYEESVGSEGTKNDMGYGDWLKSSDGYDPSHEGKSFTEMSDLIRQNKRGMQIAVITHPEAMVSGSGSFEELGVVGATNHRGVVGNIAYDDVKHAYSNTIIGVCEDTVMSQRTHHATVDSLVRERTDLETIPDRAAAERMLRDSRRMEATHDTARFYQLTKEAERSARIKSAWDANVLRLS